jgi:hypothetical protein
MKLFLFSSILFFFSLLINAQVGVGTINPATTLDVTAANPTGTTTAVDGILIPRVTRQRAQSMTATPTSTLIYINEVATGTATGTTVNVTAVGFYFFNGTAWERMGGASASNDWTTTGNTGINDITNYIGTAAATNVDVAFRRNNSPAGKISFTSTSFGVGALTSGAASTSTAFGNSALALNTTGAANVAVGTSALAANITSANNTAVGFNSLIANTAAGNSAFGYRALASNSTGTNNTAIGFEAGSLLTGLNNIMIGANTVAPVAAGNDQLNIGNTIFGSIAGAPSTGVNTTRTIGINTVAPQAALDVVSTNNGVLIPRIGLLIGANSAAPVSTIQTPEIIYNTASVGLGVNAVTPGFYFWNATRWERFNTGTITATGWSTTGNAGLIAGTPATNFIGTTDAVDVAFKRASTPAGKIAATSTSFGVNALTAGTATNGTAFGLNALAANTGTNNTAFGTNALAANNTPGDNTAIGYNTLAANTLNSGAGNLNTAVGSGALDSLNGGARNTAVGASALTGVNDNASLDNVAVGWNALPGVGTITQSVAIGSGALSNSGSGSTRSTAVGFNAGNNISQSIDSVFLGTNALGSGAVATNQIVIGSGAISTGNNSVRIGNTLIGTIGGQVSFTTTSDRRWKDNIQDSTLGLEFIKTIRPVSYFRKNDENKKTEYGFIAQELETAFVNAGDSNNAVVSKDADGMYGVRYSDFISISIKAIQEQQEQIEALKKANDELMKTNAAILKRLDALERK